ncbi:MAG TPA: PIN domain-containing protein [Patescibacteria group bacterium]|jgi:predicted nucleic-acid-binding protein|nr:PIN domain-containing protein [Patescibacteria group bacterium]
MSRVSGSLDTNVLLRLLLKDVPDQHQSAVALIKSHAGQFAIADIAIMEIVFVLTGETYGFSRAQAREAVEGVMSMDQLNCNRALFNQALPVYEARSNLSFEDCCLAVYAKLNNAEPLWTFDKKLAKQAQNTELIN